MTLLRHNPARDKSEAAIVEALRAVGWRVWSVSGSGLPDLLILRRGVLKMLECKSKGGRLTTTQVKFHDDVRDERIDSVHIVYTIDEIRELGLL